MRKPRLRPMRALIFLILAFGIITAAQVSQVMAESFMVNDENALLAMVNQHRGTHGAGPMAMDEGLRMVARRQAQRMSAAGYISHNPNLQQEAGEAVPNWLQVGENVGTAPDTPTVFQAFLASPPHHGNIDTSDFNIGAVGVIA